jgi:hypothetical protein
VPDAAVSGIVAGGAEATDNLAAPPGTTASGPAINRSNGHSPEADVDLAEIDVLPVCDAARNDKIVPLSEATLNDLWAQLLEQMPDALVAHMRNAKNLAIIGPNVVEIVFPRSYLFSMNYCRRPDVLRQLSERAQECSGQQIDIRLREDAAQGAATVASPRQKREEEDRLRPKAVEDDAFVQQAVSIFGGTVVDVRRVLVERLQPAVDEEE